MITKLESTNKALSSFGGLHIFNNLLRHLGLEERLAGLLPAAKISTRSSPFDKFKALCLGLVAGADCLDDMDRLATDPGFAAIVGKLNASNSYGDYLRSFSDAQCRHLNHALIDTALALRSAVQGKEKDFVLDIDSTSHVQRGRKMEGLAYNYKNEWCLDSLEAFDSFGFQYWMQLRPGNTYTSNSATEVMHAVFSRVSWRVRRYLRGDSGFCNVDVFNAAKDLDVGFVTAMKANMWQPLLRRVTSWKPAKHLLFHDGRKCEVGHTIYYPKGGRQTLRVVFLRALKPWEQRGSLFGDNYDYHAWVSNIGHHEMSNEELILFYRKRGNAENFIRELKNGFDAKHFPCQKLTANKAYGLVTAFAYNLMRYAARLLNPRRPSFSKIMRFRMVTLACQVVRHARSVTLRFNKTVLEEVKYWSKVIDTQFGLPSSGSG